MPPTFLFFLNYNPQLCKFQYHLTELWKKIRKWCPNLTLRPFFLIRYNPDTHYRSDKISEVSSQAPLFHYNLVPYIPHTVTGLRL